MQEQYVEQDAPILSVRIRQRDEGFSYTWNGEKTMLPYSNFLIIAACFFSLAACADDKCSRAELQGQSRDIATVQRLENAWSIAYLKGDEDLEECLLTPDFTEILGDGSIKHLQDELALARNNKGKGLIIPSFPATTVLLHGSVAAAYGTSESEGSNGKRRQKRFVDYYVWEDREWHVYFAQQTFLDTNSS
jgi:hypothetical protein